MTRTKWSTLLPQKLKLELFDYNCKLFIEWLWYQLLDDYAKRIRIDGLQEAGSQNIRSRVKLLLFSPTWYFYHSQTSFHFFLLASPLNIVSACLVSLIRTLYQGKSYFLCDNCGRVHQGQCLIGVDVCYYCKRYVHFKLECNQSRWEKQNDSRVESKLSHESRNSLSKKEESFGIKKKCLMD